jgi:hypothetical protein
MASPGKKGAGSGGTPRWKRRPATAGTYGLLVAIGAGCGSSSEPASAPGEPAPAPLCNADGSELGTAPLRRLTRFEYGRTLADLVGADPALGDNLPADEKSLGFDNIAAAHSISALHAAKYLEVAERVAEALVADAERVGAFAGCDPTREAGCVEPFVRAFGRLAFRRALADDELAAMLALYADTSTAGAADGVSAVVTAFLQAPQFLYRVEPAGTDDFGPALASRLAYLIAGTAPDAELLAAAERGELADANRLLAQADRLLASPRATEAFTHFMTEWWSLDELSTLEKDRSLYRAWTDALPAAFAEETRLFLADAWARGPTLATFLSAPHTYADATLAGFYGVEAPSGSGFQRIELDPERASGLLTQGAFLATHAKANQTSPIHRGKFVRERLFCTPPEPPPEDVVVRPPVVDPRLSTRERFSAHTAEPRCAGCHALMDPIGFAFEHYDATGTFRSVDGGKPIDASGELTGTDVDRTLDGVPSLAAALLESEQVRTCVATQWFRYAFGRQESASGGDVCTIESLAHALATSGGDLKSALRATVTSALFRSQRPAEGTP